MPEIYLRYAWDTPEICLRYTWYISEIYLKHLWNISKISLRYPWYMPEIYLRYAWDMPEISLRYAWDMPEISLRHAWDMPEMCLRHRDRDLDTEEWFPSLSLTVYNSSTWQSQHNWAHTRNAISTGNRNWMSWKNVCSIEHAQMYRKDYIFRQKRVNHQSGDVGEDDWPIMHDSF